MIEAALRIPAYRMFRRFGFPKLHPLSLTVSVTCRCNSRCRTCRIYEKKVQEFTLEEFDKSFSSIGKGVFWITMSGGEPFLREDFGDICKRAYVRCRPKILNIPTNGILSDRIVENVEQIAKAAPDAQIIVNVSLDEVGEKHDEIRNVRGNFAKAVNTFERLKSLKEQGCRNLNVGIHTVISQYNVENFVEIHQELTKMKPDSYITEIAEERVELGTVGKDITPRASSYFRAIDYLCERIRAENSSGISQITQAFRSQYYRMVKRVLLEERQVLPCYAGWLSAQIAADGEVWACCVQGESMGSLREENYDFGKVWFSKRAQEIRKPVREGKCFCPLANAGYTNMLASYRTVARVFWTMCTRRMLTYGRKTVKTE
jgi:MoaA/NifB/PqqE/SkfB family radical SAM enzyme